VTSDGPKPPRAAVRRHHGGTTHPAAPVAEDAGRRDTEHSALLIEERFAVVREWLTRRSHFRLRRAPLRSAAPLRTRVWRQDAVTGQRDGIRARENATDTIDRALRELIGDGAVSVTPR
jgi:hypothetical protein